MIKSILVATFLLSLGMPNTAQAKSEIFILFGSKDKTVAAKWLKNLSAKKTAVTFPTQYPKLIEAASVPGLNPGFWLVVGGYCVRDSADDSSLVTLTRKALAKKVSGSYSKEVSLTSDRWSCPLIEGGIKFSKDSLEKDLLLRANAYNEEMEIDQLEYVARYILMLNPENAKAKEYAQKIMVLKTD